MHRSLMTTGRRTTISEPFAVGDRDVIQLNGLFGQRAHLLADDAVDVLCPWNAAVLIYLGLADDRLLFLRQRQLGNGAGRADLAAAVAGVVAVAQPRHHHRCPGAVEVGACLTGVDGPGGADADADAAADAFLHHVVFRRARRPQPSLLRAAQKGGQAQQGHAGQHDAE